MLLLCWFDHFLDSRAEICQIFRWLFGKSMTPKRHSAINWPLSSSATKWYSNSILKYKCSWLRVSRDQKETCKPLSATFSTWCYIYLDIQWCIGCWFWHISLPCLFMELCCTFGAGVFSKSLMDILQCTEVRFITAIEVVNPREKNW